MPGNTPICQDVPLGGTLCLDRRADDPAGGVLYGAADCRGKLPLDQIELPTPQINPDLVKNLQPSNDRDWSPDQAVLAYAEFLGDRVRVHNIRNCTYDSADDYVVHYYDKTFDLGKLTSVDFIAVPFPDLPGVAHTMLSFGFEDRDYLGVSVEIRKEKGEQYDAVKGFLRQYELIYNVADERDLIQKYAVHQKYDVYVYRARATPARPAICSWT